MSLSTAELKQHLESARQTRQITNAMYLLSTSRLKRAMLGMDYTIKYMSRLRASMNDILYVTKGAGIHNRFLDVDVSGSALFLSVMGDKGLCGSYNTAVAELTYQKMQSKPNSMLFCFGMVGKENLIQHGLTPNEVLPGSSMHPSIELASELSKKLIEMYITDRINQVYIVYTPYSRGKREPVCLRLLPLLRHDFNDIPENYETPTELMYEPSAEDVFEHLVPLYCSGMIYDILVQSAASENAARMEAMQSASSNADDMIKNYQIQLNALRQQQITSELTEIAAATSVSGAV